MTLHSKSALCPDLIIKEGAGGQWVIKDPARGAYFSIGEEEHFLLDQISRSQSHSQIAQDFMTQFGEELDPADFEQFLQTAREQGLLAAEAEPGPPPTLSIPPPPDTRRQAPRRSARNFRSLLYWRKSLFDPDSFLERLVPRVWWIWTWPFVAISAAAIVLAALLMVQRHDDLLACLTFAPGWHTALLAWLLLIVLTTCHELAHGATCKHYGGEVHEVGLLILFFMPCLYCNVSDAWFIRDKSKRLAVTAAGTYCDLCLGAVAVFLWRLTMPHMALNYVAAIAASVLMTRLFFNLNPLLKLDGYYLLSDGLGIENLQSRGLESVRTWGRRLLWGGQTPQTETGQKWILAYGLLSWLFSTVFLAILVVSVARILGQAYGTPGLLVGLTAVAGAGGGTLRWLSGGEFSRMLRERRARRSCWIFGTIAGGGLIAFMPLTDHAGGMCKIRAAVYCELRAPVACFFDRALADEGSVVSAGTTIAQLRVANLHCQMAQKKAEEREIRSKLKLLEIGPRPEQVQAQKGRVERARARRDQAAHEVERAQKIEAEELARLDRQIAQLDAQAHYARDVWARSRRLVNQGALAEERFDRDLQRQHAMEAQEAQAQAQKRARLLAGTRDSETELLRRQCELQDEESALKVLQAGSRPEEIEAMKAELARLDAELHQLEVIEQQLTVYASVSGVVTTEHLDQKVGQYLHEGELIARVENLSGLEAEVVLADEDLARVRPGQPVELKIRAFPFLSVKGRVKHVSSRAEPSELHSTMVARCSLDDPPGELRPGLVGYARIETGSRPLREMLLERVWRLLRTEFW
jgi:multidrug efflux pump subunit AcrA (membrane-fusion protein)